jgi:hypothetical protein
MTEEDPPAIGKAIESAVAETEPFLPGNVAEGRQVFSPDIARHELNLAKQQLSAEEKRHELEEAARDNESRSKREEAGDRSRRRRQDVGFYSILSVVIVGLAVSLAIGTMAKNADTRNFAQNAFILILGAILGALAGYFTGRSGN